MRTTGSQLKGYRVEYQQGQIGHVLMVTAYSLSEAVLKAAAALKPQDEIVAAGLMYRRAL